MKRIHPCILQGACKRMLTEGEKGFEDGILDGLKYWINVFQEEIGAIDPREVPLMIATLKVLEDSYSQAFPGSKEIAADITKSVRKRVAVVGVMRNER